MVMKVDHVYFGQVGSQLNISKNYKKVYQFCLLTISVSHLFAESGSLSLLGSSCSSTRR